MRYLPPLVLLVLSPYISAADDLRHLPFSTDIFGDVYEPVRTPDSQVVTNSTILDPTGELLPPIMATRMLGEEDYFEWCLRWNRRQYALAAKRAIPPRRIYGAVTKQTGYSQSSSAFGYSRSSGRQYYNSTTRSRQQVWYVGGYGGGPVMIYNPFVPPQAAQH